MSEKYIFFALIKFDKYLFTRQIIHADFDDEDDAYLLTISIAKPGRPLKPKAKPAPVRNVAKRPEVKPPEPVKETAKPKLKAKAKPAPKSAPKAPPKEKLEDPFFQTEEYEVSYL